MPQINLTDSWTQLDNRITQNSGMIVTGGTSVELLTSSSLPTTESKGRIFYRSEVSNIYYGVSTFIRSNTGNASIFLDEMFFNFKSSNIVIYYNGLSYDIDLEKNKITISQRININSAPLVSDILTYAYSLLVKYGYKYIANTVRSSSTFHLAMTDISSFFDGYVTMDSIECQICN